MRVDFGLRFYIGYVFGCSIYWLGRVHSSFCFVEKAEIYEHTTYKHKKCLQQWQNQYTTHSTYSHHPSHYMMHPITIVLPLIFQKPFIPGALSTTNPSPSLLPYISETDTSLSSANPSNLLNQSLNTHPSTQGSSLVSLPSPIFFSTYQRTSPL